MNRGWGTSYGYDAPVRGFGTYSVQYGLGQSMTQAASQYGPYNPLELGGLGAYKGWDMLTTGEQVVVGSVPFAVGLATLGVLTAKTRMERWEASGAGLGWSLLVGGPALISLSPTGSISRGVGWALTGLAGFSLLFTTMPRLA